MRPPLLFSNFRFRRCIKTRTNNCKLHKILLVWYEISSFECKNVSKTTYSLVYEFFYSYSPGNLDFAFSVYFIHKCLIVSKQTLNVFPKICRARKLRLVPSKISATLKRWNWLELTTKYAKYLTFKDESQNNVKEEDKLVSALLSV